MVFCESPRYRANMPLSLSLGVGRTSCVGKVLFYHEMKIRLARIIWLYDIRLQPICFLDEDHESVGEGRMRTHENT